MRLTLDLEKAFDMRNNVLQMHYKNKYINKCTINSKQTKRFIVSNLFHGTSTKLSIGNKWWYDLAKCGLDTSVSSHTGQSVGKSQIFELHRAQM